MLFGIRVVDADAPSYCCCTPPDVLQSAELDKKKSIYRPVKIVELLFPLFVFLLMDYCKKADFSSIVFVIFSMISGRALSA